MERAETSGEEEMLEEEGQRVGAKLFRCGLPGAWSTPVATRVWSPGHLSAPWRQSEDGDIFCVMGMLRNNSGL